MDCGSIEMVKKVNLVFKTPEGGSINRASDILRKKRQNFAGFSGANSRKNQPIWRDFRGKNFKIRGKIGRYRGIFAGKKSIFERFSGQILRKIGRFHEKFRGKLRQETISKKQPISLDIFWQISLKSINFASI